MSGHLGGRHRAAGAPRLAVPRRASPVATTPASGWVELPAPPSPFENAAPPAVSLADGGLVLVGSGEGSNKVWTFDPTTTAYTSTTDAAGSDERGGELVGTGSYLFSVANPSVPHRWVAGTWTTRANGPASGSGLSTCQAGGLIYVMAGGFFASYDPSGNSWTNLSYPSNSDTGADDPMVADGGNIYLFSGLSTSKYVIGSNTWDAGTTLAARPTRIYGSAIGLIDGKAYLAGGYTEPSFGPSSRLDIYDLGGDSWTAGPAMATASSALAGCVLDGSLYVFGTDSVPFARVYIPPA